MADKIVAEYTVKVDKAIKDLEKLAKKVDKVDNERKKTQDGFKSMSNQLSSGFKKVGSAIGLAFGVDQIVSFGKEAVKLAAQAEGVERAFRRIGGANSANLLDGLRKATRGTVSDVQLMQKAVQASNFKIPLENLASLFSFAQARARETGESVEYLTNSIVLGIGRKSPLILDNLGISAVELRKRLKGVGVEAANVGDIAKIIGDIAEEELSKMGNQADTTADQIEKITAAFENMQVKAGKAINDVIKGLVKMAEKQGLIESKTPFREQIRQTMEYARAVREAAYSIEDDRSRELSIMDDVNDKEAFIQNKKEERIELLKKLEKDLSQVTSTETRKAENLKLWFAEQALESAVGLDVFKRGAAKERIKEAREDIKENTIKEGILRKQIEALKEILGLTIDDDGGGGGVKSYTKSINKLNEELRDYQKDLKNAEVGSSEFFAIIDKVTAKTKELNDAIALTKLEDALKVDVEGEDEGQDGFIQAQLDFLDKEFPEATFGAVDYADNLWKEHFKNKMDMNEEEYQQWLELQRKKQQEQELETQRIKAAFEATSQIFSSFVAIQGAAREQELRGLEEQLNQGLIAREEYELKRKQILQDQAEDEKAAAIFEATVNGALAVVNAYNTDSTGILAGIVGAIVAAQIAAIAAQPVPQYEEGGFVDSKGYISGRSHKTGGVLIEAEGGEYITSKKYAQRNKDILEAINSGNWEKYKFENIISPAIEQVLEGGMDNIGSSIVLQNKFNDKNMLRAFDRNRSAARQDAQYIVSELSKNFKGRLRGGFA